MAKVQTVRYLRSSFPYSRGDEVGLSDLVFAEKMRKAGAVEFIGDAVEKIAPPPDPAEQTSSDDPPDPDGENPADRVNIPDNWQGLHHTVLCSIASQIIGEKVTTKEKAVETIKDELARRRAVASGNG